MTLVGRGFGISPGLGGGGGDTLFVDGALDAVVEDNMSVEGVVETQVVLSGVVEVGDVDFFITRFVADAPLLEIGTVASAPSFTSHQTSIPVTLTLTNDSSEESKDVVLTPLAPTSDENFSLVAPGTITFTLTGDDDCTSDSETTPIEWQTRHFVGITTNPGPYVEADILALEELTSELTPATLFDVSFTALDQHYVVHVYADIFTFDATKYISDDLFETGMVETQTGVSMARPNGTFLVNIARSGLLDTFGGTLRIERRI